MTALSELLKRQAGQDSIRVSGLAGSSKAYLLSQLPEGRSGNGLVCLTATPKEATRLQSDLEFFGMETEFFPPWDAFPFSNLSPHPEIECQRMRILNSLVRGQPLRWVTTAAAFFPLLPPREVLSLEKKLRLFEAFDREALFQQLSQWGYQKVTLVSDRGTFAVRGSLVDLFTPSLPSPVRIEWTGDLIESIRSFDPKTQKSLAPLEEISLIPCRAILLNPETQKRFERKIRAIAEERDIPKSAWGPLIEKVNQGIFFSGIESFLPLFYETTSSIWDYLENSPVVADETGPWKEAIDDYQEEVQILFSAHPPLVRPSDLLLSEEALSSKLKKAARLIFSPFSEESKIPIETHERIREFASLAKKIDRWAETDQVTLVAPSETQKSRLQDLLHPYFPNRFPFQIRVGSLSGGFRLPEERITYLTDEEIFGPRLHRPVSKSFQGGLSLSSLSEIKEGDPIVHKQHGIGLYQGLLPMKIDGIQNDFLILEYKGGDKLYLPVFRMNLIQKYSGADQAPRIDRLGSSTWQNLRQKAEKAIREMAGELLNLYAARSVGKGFSFSAPNELFEAFEASFPYDETADQEKAIQETLADMQKPQPMDRLILGDVGYGKTEVAMRAALLTILSGKQVAILVPTTLLAFQHLERFTERFRDLPVRIEMISRFRSKAEQKKILQELKEGKIDILIGTHRLLQPDISFKELGLLVIDEEHRFGVLHKERIKHFRKSVDVLTLSATPIPRTLYMSLIGIRPISVIETPPNDRLAIRTFVLPFEESIIREAILREIKRGGQAFFVHNQVETIGAMKKFLDQLIPEAKSEIAHGQMKEEELEEVMIRFYHQKFQILICTTIIESGIDISTANTIFINKAERFGLAQIYQLRGRVGRSGHRAFAYFLVSENSNLSAQAAERLKVLQKFSELGSGFRMASYDLEIRGAGNLLGDQQSGQITAIGYELYTELLEGAVRELKGGKVLQEIDPELHFKLPATLPSSYLPDPPLRLEWYRKLASLESEEEIEPIRDELVDRFGKIPPEVENLLELSAIKTYAKKLRLKQVRYDGKNFSYAFDPSTPLPPEILTQMIEKDKRIRLTPDSHLIIQKPLADSLILMETKKFLRNLALYVAEKT